MLRCLVKGGVAPGDACLSILLPPLLDGLLRTESNHKVKRRALQLLALVRSSSALPSPALLTQRGEIDQPTCGVHEAVCGESSGSGESSIDWRVLASIVTDSRQVRVQVHALVCFGTSFKEKIHELTACAWTGGVGLGQHAESTGYVSLNCV